MFRRLKQWWRESPALDRGVPGTVGLRRVMMSIGHLGAMALVLMVALTAATVLIGDYADGHGPGLVYAVVVSVGMSMITFVGVSWRFHDSTLCLRCVRQMPLNGADEADRYRWTLRLVHWVVHRSRKVKVVQMSLIGVSFAASFFVDGWADAALLIPAYAPAVLLVAVIGRHNRLQPWCPYCRRDDGDDNVPEVPDGPGGRTVDEGHGVRA